MVDIVDIHTRQKVVIELLTVEGSSLSFIIDVREACMLRLPYMLT